MLECLHSCSKRQIQHSSNMQRWGLYFHTIETIQKHLAQILEETTLNIYMKSLLWSFYHENKVFRNYLITSDPWKEFEQVYLKIFFNSVYHNTICDLQLAESTDVEELYIQRANYGFLTTLERRPQYPFCLRVSYIYFLSTTNIESYSGLSISNLKIIKY